MGWVGVCGGMELGMGWDLEWDFGVRCEMLGMGAVWGGEGCGLEVRGSFGQLGEERLCQGGTADSLCWREYGADKGTECCV